MMNRPCRLAVLGSTNGTHLLGLIAAIQENQLAASIEVVASNKPDALILSRARAHALPALVIDYQSGSREAVERVLSRQLKEFSIDVIVLIGYMRILTSTFVADWAGQIINIHPSLLPAFAGGMDRQVHQAVLEAQASESGCTVHIVTETVDAGPIIVQKKCPVYREDTVEVLRARVQQLEGPALIEAIQFYRNQHE